MNAKTSKDIIQATQYLQEKIGVAIDPDVFWHFPALPLPSRSKSKVCHTPPRILQENS